MAEPLDLQRLEAVAHRVATGHRRASRLRRKRLHVELLKTQALGGQAVQHRRAHCATVKAHILPAEIVNRDVEDVGRTGRGSQPGSEQRREQHTGKDETQWHGRSELTAPHVTPPASAGERLRPAPKSRAAARGLQSHRSCPTRKSFCGRWSLSGAACGSLARCATPPSSQGWSRCCCCCGARFTCFRDAHRSSRPRCWLHCCCW